MARVKLSEYRAKSLLVPDYIGVTLRLDSLDEDLANLSDDQNYVIKVDQGVKKRGKQGLIKLNVTKASAKEAINELSEKGFQRFIAEPMIPHEDNEERYVSFERTRDGIAINYSEMGGVDIEDHPESVKHYTIEDVPLEKSFVSHVVEVMDQQHMSFVEINPLLVRESLVLLDAAVLADSAGEYQASWTEDDIVEARNLSESEAAIAELNDNSPAAFSFRVLNENGSIWLLLSGGGASITIADESANQHKAEYIGDYGEYSGGPSTEETYLYTTEVLHQALKSKAPKIALIIAGGVANFTDVKKTFTGVIQALTENLEALHKKNVRVFVRRGGPNEKEGLELMRKFLEGNNLFGSVHGSDIVLTDVINEALEYVDA
ncbi:MAG TPA: ATP citrate lyase citrate-binding domain-containing protein [Candidatus Saccharimonadales bacterium]